LRPEPSIAARHNEREGVRLAILDVGDELHPLRDCAWID
jgi:hypothetical protein